jgi:NAD(P)-dependent dehydrogenase (short-subunit alcohol dehydrogenase family)
MTRLRDLFDLSGKTAIVTGGGSGLGKQIADGLAEMGANLVLCARKVERCEAAAEDIRRESGVEVLALPCDVRNDADIAAVVASAESHFGHIDILVNNAGTTWGAPALDYPREGWQKVIDVNLTGTFLVSQAVGRVMAPRGTGAIVNISSAAALGGGQPELMDTVAYNSSKGGVLSLTRDLAVKWARFGIRVNAIAPGWFPTEMSREVLSRREPDYLRGIPLGRFGGNDDLKGAAVFLASPASGFITGQTIVIDGGQTVGWGAEPNEARRQ